MREESLTPTDMEESVGEITEKMVEETIPLGMVPPVMNLHLYLHLLHHLYRKKPRKDLHLKHSIMTMTKEQNPSKIFTK